MFTGLIREIGTIVSIHTVGKTASLLIHAPQTAAEAALGDSIAVNGACLTVSALDRETFTADLSEETLQRTSFASMYPGSKVNLEPALRLTDKLGGHLVSGHVDGVGILETLEGDGDFWHLTVRFPEALAPYIAEKGSICIEGISLTVADVSDEIAGVAIIPATMKNTTLQDKNPGDPVNIEVDLIARYIERIVTSRHGHGDVPTGLTLEKLVDYGYPLGS